MCWVNYLKKKEKRRRGGGRRRRRGRIKRREEAISLLLGLRRLSIRPRLAGRFSHFNGRLPSCSSAFKPNFLPK